MGGFVRLDHPAITAVFLGRSARGFRECFGTKKSTVGCYDRSLQDPPCVRDGLNRKSTT
jgi:hypothetical protein